MRLVYRGLAGLSVVGSLLLIGLAASPIAAQEAKQPLSAEAIAAKADEYIQAQVAVNRFTGSVLVARGEQVIFAKGCGLANVEHDVPNTPRTKFRLGSITKQFTGTAILILQEQGKLSVDDPASKHVEGLPEAWKEVTIHHLVTHTSGIPSFTSLPSYRESMPLPSPPAKTLERVRDMPLEFKPGEKFTYSNSGYVLLGQIIEKASGKSYEEFVRENIFQPLGMADSGYDLPEKILRERAAGYRRQRETLVHALYLDMTIPHAAGALYSTALDLHRWSRALDEGQLLSSESRAKMFTAGKGNYGYGWFIDKQHGRTHIGHGGGINGFSTQISRFPDDEKLCVVALCNVEPSSPGRVASDLAAIALGEKYELPTERKFVTVDAKLLDNYVGEYEVRPGLVLTVSCESDKLFGQPTGQPKVELRPLSDVKFFVKEVDAEITFGKDEAGKITHLNLLQGGRNTEAKRIK